MKSIDEKSKKKLLVDKNLVENKQIALLKTSYHAEFSDNMEETCRLVLTENGVKEENIKTFVAPGAWELPLLVQKILKSRRFDSVAVFGVVIKGETYHFEMIANEVAAALMRLSLDYSTPVAFEVLAVYSRSQAEARAGKSSENKGKEAAEALLQQMINLSLDLI